MNRIAIMIDGGFYLKQLPRIRRDVDHNSADAVVQSIRQLVRGHLQKLARIQQTTFYNATNGNRDFVLEPNWYSQHYRTFYYDASPLSSEIERPISKESLNLSQTSSFHFRNELFRLLKRERNLALRLGETRASQQLMWQIRPAVLERLINGEIKFNSLKDSDFVTTIRQKGVDMRLGLDMASLALKRQANIFVLVTGDADFVPAAKLVRREGCQVILDPMYKSVTPKLFEHIDGLDSGFFTERNERTGTSAGNEASQEESENA